MIGCWGVKKMNRVKELSEKWTKDQIIIALWDLLDDIDTVSDLVLNDADTQREENNNNEIYRKSVEKIIKKRWYLGIESDGYDLYLRGEKIGL